MTDEDVKLLEHAMQSAKAAHHRLDRVEADVGDLQKLTETVAVLASNMSSMRQDMSEIKQDVRSLSRVPADRWNAVIGYVTAALISGIVGVVIGVLGR